MLIVKMRISGPISGRSHVYTKRDFQYYSQKKISELDLPRQKRDLAFPDVSQIEDFFLSSSVRFHQKNRFGI